ncbi:MULTISPECIES: very short patch repair endonuclease [unclassified Sphingopyxis]|uniref:very short patch repair endonuclease n=1 Tax=unclassified Sphingopyxis TaxID=2614943 RepID=UPI0018D2249B|nr:MULTISPECIES: very short patch repair endonuclease [unclassified Sphingopyxis]
MRKPTTDVDPARSAQMARIKGRDTKPEMRVRRALHAAGLRYRLHAKNLPGKPDIVLPSRRIAIFVHGCFWHRHPDPSCKLARMPKSRIDFWQNKLEGNRARDERNEAALRTTGWDVRVIWECEISEHTLTALAHQCLAAPNPRRSQAKSPYRARQ